MGLIDFLKIPVIKPTVLITEEDREWVEGSFLWLSERFGLETLRFPLWALVCSGLLCTFCIFLERKDRREGTVTPV